MKVRALGNQLTFYDDDGNVIGHDPPLPPEDPDERVLNIVDFEDRLMGIDPDAVPDFFIDLEELERFVDENEAKRPAIPTGPASIDAVVYGMLLLTLMFVLFLFGYLGMENYLDSYIEGLRH